MSSTTRPKPRPVARRARAPSAVPDVPASSSPGPSSATATQQATTVPALPSIEDEDALFLRNRQRTAQAWKEISKMNEERESRKRKSSSSDGSDDGGPSPRSRNRKRRVSKKKDGVLPDWTKKRPADIVLSSDSEDDIIIETKAQSKSTGGGKGSSPQPRNESARSRSITPPPALPQYAIQRAREAVQQLVGDRPRAPSPTDFVDDSVDNIELDPELASIARKVQSEALRGGTPAVEDIGGPEDVNIRIAWKPHPLDPNGRADIWAAKQKRHTNFHALFAEVADLASIKSDNLVVCYDGKRVFPSSNPHSIGIWAEAELEAYDKVTYQYLQEHKRMRSPSVAPFLGADPSRRSPSRTRSPSIELLSDSDNEPPASAPSQGDEEESNTFHLTVRSARTNKDISLLVRPSTKCGAIVRAFLKKAGLEAEYPVDAGPQKGRVRGKAAPAKAPALSVDGDKMDPETEIGEADLEDGDLVEVVGL